MTTPKRTIRSVRIYDNGGKTCDRYTAVFPWDRNSSNGYVAMLGMSENPFSPLGFGQHSEGIDGDHLGKRISFSKLPADCQRCIEQDLKAYNSAQP